MLCKGHLDAGPENKLLLAVIQALASYGHPAKKFLEDWLQMISRTGLDRTGKARF